MKQYYVMSKTFEDDELWNIQGPFDLREAFDKIPDYVYFCKIVQELYSKE